MAAALLLASGVLAHGAARAEQYESGVTRWDVKDGKLMLVAGVLTDNSRLYYLNYAFYLEGRDNTLTLIPIVKDKAKLNDYSLNFSTFNGGDDIITDAMVVVKGGNTWLVTAHKNAVHGYNSPGPVSTQTYRLFAGGEVQWKYYFAPVAKGDYTEQQNYTVERALAETAKALH
ncbi:hypothetical protein G3N95_33365 [Paraburkholderia sp. Tr-20389]|nr:hypothetical protein [Paraburkholderia sp. Tr-20389]